MYWLLFAFAAAVVYLIWKGIRNTPPVAIQRPSAPPTQSAAISPSITPPAPAPTREPMPAMVVVVENERLQQEPQPMHIPDRDAWEDWSDELYGAESRALAADLAITYCDRDGKLTQRNITVEKYGRTQDGGTLAAYCHLRKARRPFRFSRIKTATEIRTGDKISDIGLWLDKQYDASPNGIRDKFIEKNESALGALFFIAKADGAFRAKEKLVLQNFCASQGLDNAAIQPLVVEAVAGWAVPSRIAYGKDLRSLLAQGEDYRKSVVQYAKAMVAASKTPTDETKRALERMERELKISPPPGASN